YLRDQPQYNFMRPALVQRGLPGRARLPAAMDPQPLIGIVTDEILNDFREELCIGSNVGLIVAGANQLHGGIETQAVAAQDRIPQGKSRQNGGVRAEGN